MDIKYRRHVSNPLYRTWLGMHHRCYKPHRKDYKFYGGRGIFVCERWHRFENFVDDMGGSFLPGLSIDRINNEGEYSSPNCRWTDHKTQCVNRRSTNRIVDPSDDQVLSLTELADKYKIPRGTLSNRMHRSGCCDVDKLIGKNWRRGNWRGARRTKYDPFKNEFRKVVD